MKNTCLYILFFCLTVNIFADVADVFSLQQQIQQYGDRREGTDSEKKAFDAIAERLDAIGVSYKRIPLDTISKGHSYSQIIEATISGKYTSRYVLASPVEKGAFSTAVLLELANYFTSNPPNNTVKLLFLGAERGNTELHPYGSRYVLENLLDNTDTFTVYIDSSHIPRKWKLIVGRAGIFTPFWLIKGLVDILDTRNMIYDLPNADLYAGRLGYVETEKRVLQWFKSGIPTVVFQGQEFLESERINVGDFIAVLTELDKIPADQKKMAERNYLYFKPFKNNTLVFIVRELVFVLFIMSVILIVMVAILSQYRKVMFNIKRLKKHLLAWPAIFVLFFIVITLSTMLVRLNLNIGDSPGLWLYVPQYFVFFKISTVIAIISAVLLLNKKVVFTHNPHFYCYAAVISSGVLNLMVMWLDMTLSLYVLWSSIMFLLFLETKKIAIKFILLVFATIPYIIVINLIVTKPYIRLLEHLLLSRISGSLIISLTFLPIVFGFMSLYYSFNYYLRLRKSPFLGPTCLLFGFFCVMSFIWLMGYSPFDKDMPQPIQIVDYINEDLKERKLEFSSPVPIGDTDVRLDGIGYSLSDAGSKAHIPVLISNLPLTIDVSEFSFLGRRTVELVIDGPTFPNHVDVKLFSSEPFIVHTSSMPFEVSLEGQNAVIYIGDNPKFPLNLQLTISKSEQIELSVRAIWNEPDSPPVLSRDDIKTSNLRIVDAKTIF